MKCKSCGKEIDGNGSFCPYCGQSIDKAEPMDETLLYETDVKVLLKPPGRLAVYKDRVEYVESSVRKTVFSYASVVSFKKILDRIEFIMEDGRRESCPAGKNAERAVFVMEKACSSYVREREERLQGEGIRFSFPSAPAGLNAIRGGGILDIRDDRADYRTPQGKTDTVEYRDVRSVCMTRMGTLKFTLHDRAEKSFNVPKEQRENVSSFVEGRVKEYLAERQRELLEKGIRFSFLSDMDSAAEELRIYLADRMEFAPGTKLCRVIPYDQIREIRMSAEGLAVSLTDGTTAAFTVNREDQEEVLAFLEEKIAPYVEKRTAGFDTSFGAGEKIEVNAQRGVFHIIRQGGREISEEYPIGDIVKAEASEEKAQTGVIAGVLSAGIDSIRGKADTEDRIGSVCVSLTVRMGQGMKEVRVRFGSFPYGVTREDNGYLSCIDELDSFFSYMESSCPDCERIPIVVEEKKMEPEIPEIPADEEFAVDEPEEETLLPDAEKTEERGSGFLAKEQFSATRIDWILDSLISCEEPIFFLQGDWGSGENCFMRIIYDELKGGSGGYALWFDMKPFSGDGSMEETALEISNELLKALGVGFNNMETIDKALDMGNIAVKWLSKGTFESEDIKKLFRGDTKTALKKQIATFKELAKNRSEAGGGKIVIFADDLNGMAPARAAKLLDALSNFFDRKSCVFVANINKDVLLRGKQECEGHDFTETEKEVYLDKMCRSICRVPINSFNIQRYVEDNLDKIGIETDDEAEIRRYADLARYSVGRNPNALNHLFQRFRRLSRAAGGRVCSRQETRQALFALLCMQSAFGRVYDQMLRMKDRITPDLLSGLCREDSELAVQSGLEGDKKQRYMNFAGALLDSISEGYGEGVTQEQCAEFMEALEISEL